MYDREPSTRTLHGGAQLRLAVLGQLAVQLSAQGELEPPTDLRSGGDARGQQIVAGDRQAHVAELGEPSAGGGGRPRESLLLGQGARERHPLQGAPANRRRSSEGVFTASNRSTSSGPRAPSSWCGRGRPP